MTLGQNAFGEQQVDPTIELLSAPWRQIGVMLEMDRGDGVLSIVPLTEISGDITIRGTINAFGVREMSFSLFGDAYSPFKRDVLHSMRQVRLTGFLGIPGVVASKQMFNGYIRDATMTAVPAPPVAQFDCQDESLLYVDQPLFYTLEPASLRARVDVIVDALAQVGIPAGVFELPNGDSGVIFKAVSEAGDRRIFDFLSEYLQPIGATGYWRNGVYNFKRFDTSGDPRRIFSVGDIRSLSIDPPATNAPNQVKVSSSMFAYLGPGGIRIVTETVENRALYTPVVATSVQDHTTGVVSPISVAPVQDITSRVVTTTHYDGGTVIYRDVQTYGWYAPKACRYRQTAAGAITYNGTFDVYIFPDGSARSQNSETFQLISDTATTRTFDPTTGVLTQEEAVVEEFSGVEIPRGTANMPFSGAFTPNDVLITTNGTDAIAWQGGKEDLTLEYNVKTFFLNVDGTLNHDVVQIQNYSAIEYGLFAPVNGSTYGSTVYVLGSASAPKYGLLTFGLFARGNFSQFVTVYAAIDASSHTETKTFSNPTNYYPPSFQKAELTAASGAFTVAGPVPFLEIKTSNQQPQPATFTINDNTRRALSQNKTITEFLQNGYCEADTELETVGVEAMRAIASPIVTVETPIDWSIDEGDVIGIVHPRFAYALVKLLVLDIQWTISPGTGRNSQLMTCRWETPELVALAA